jgi:hypothetical protein
MAETERAEGVAAELSGNSLVTDVSDAELLQAADIVLASSTPKAVNFHFETYTV